MLRLPKDDADVLKHVAVLTVYKLFYIYVCVCVCIYIYILYIFGFYIINCTGCTVHTSNYIWKSLVCL